MPAQLAALPRPALQPARALPRSAGQGEALQNWGEAVLATCAALPDGELSPAREAEAAALAAQLFQQAVAAYKQVGQGPRARGSHWRLYCITPGPRGIEP